MQKLKLYKFRPLANRIDFDRAKVILETGCFWCSQFSELNDPMEGVFWAEKPELMKDIYGEKNKYKICSFSDEKAFVNPAMWGYYANGFKGIAIEIEIGESEVKEVTYRESVPCVRDYILGATVEGILTTKLKPWEHEYEYRFLRGGERSYHKIGEIIAVYFGDPYGNVENANSVKKDNKSISEYNKSSKDLMEIAVCLGLERWHVEINDRGNVTPRPADPQIITCKNE